VQVVMVNKTINVTCHGQHGFHYSAGAIPIVALLQQEE
jgi:hypothetical protein